MLLAGAAAGTIVVAAALVFGLSAQRYSGGLQTVASYALLASAGIAGAMLLWSRDGRGAVITVVAVALAARLALVVFPPLHSNDAYRYLWDGRLLLHGFDPYVVTPDATVLHPLRLHDWLYRHIDWNHVPTLYPPLALALFALAAAIDAHSLLATKVVLLLGDVTTLVLMLAILKTRRLPAGRAALYAWNPLVITEFAHSGHVDAWANAALLGAILALEAKRPLRCGFALAAATLLKLYPLALAPVFFVRSGMWRGIAVLAVVLVAAYAPFVWWHRDAFGFLPQFALGYSFNASLAALTGAPISAALFVLAIATAVIARARGAGLAAALIFLELAYLVLSPNVYPWYTAVFAALVPLLPRPFDARTRSITLALVAWTILAPLAYADTWVYGRGSLADDVVHVVEYAPLAIGLAWFAFPSILRSGRWLLAPLFLGACAHIGAYQRAASDAPAVAAGERIFAERCAICHTPTARSEIGPDLTHVAARRSYGELQRHLATALPRPALSHGQVYDLLAYFARLDAGSTSRDTRSQQR